MFLSRFTRIFTFADQERADLLAEIARLNDALVLAKAETAQALLNDASDAATITAANAALADAQATRDEAVAMANEAGTALLNLKQKAAELQKLADDALEDQGIETLAEGIESRIPEGFSVEPPVEEEPVEEELPVEEEEPDPAFGGVMEEEEEEEDATEEEEEEEGIV